MIDKDVEGAFEHDVHAHADFTLAENGFAGFKSAHMNRNLHKAQLFARESMKNISLLQSLKDIPVQIVPAKQIVPHEVHSCFLSSVRSISSFLTQPLAPSEFCT